MSCLISDGVYMAKWEEGTSKNIAYIFFLIDLYWDGRVCCITQIHKSFAHRVVGIVASTRGLFTSAGCGQASSNIANNIKVQEHNVCYGAMCHGIVGVGVRGHHYIDMPNIIMLRYQGTKYTK
ncbi:hypothetical protein ACJX0J_012117 [Zea mays]